MRIAVKDIPQADLLDDVIKTVIAVRRGNRTYQQMATAINKVERQGRYYRRAAEILGFIKKGPVKNTSELTSRGNTFIGARRELKKNLLTKAILQSAVMQRILPFLESRLPDGCTREELELFIGAVTESTTLSMLHRRASTIVAWLQYINMVEERDERYILKIPPSEFGVAEYTDDKEPLLPTSFSLSEYNDIAQRITRSQSFVISVVRQVRRERASNAHIRLTNLVAEKVRRAGAIPRCNRLVDLAAHIGQEPFIFEMKSTTESNVQSQIRRGVSQLYEYRYLQGVPTAKLVLVIERPLPCSLAWMSDYLIQDRRILPVWDLDGDRLHCPQSVRAELDFLVL